MPTLGTEVFASDLNLRPGGGAYITAANLSALGHPTSLASMLPSTPFADAISDEIAASGINLDLCKLLDPATGPQLTVALVQDGERSFVSRRNGPAVPELSGMDFAAGNASHLHIGELATLLEVPELLTMARGAQMTVSLDCSWDESIDAGAIGDLISKVDIFLPNKMEAHRLEELNLTLPFAPLTVVKSGPKGATAYHGGEVLQVGTEAIEAFDTTGAGDAFNAGFLSAWLQGNTLQQSVVQGNLQAGKEILNRGASLARSSNQNLKRALRK